MEQGGVIAWSILAVLVIMSVGSWYVFFTKIIEQQKIMNQYKSVRTTFWRAPSLREGANKLEKNSAYRQIVDDGLVAQDVQDALFDAGSRWPRCRACASASCASRRSGSWMSRRSAGARAVTLASEEASRA